MLTASAEGFVPAVLRVSNDNRDTVVFTLSRLPMRTLLATLLAGGTLGAVPPATFTGTIIDAECARAGHSSMRMGPTDAECARACVMAHDSAFVLEDGATVYLLSDHNAAERFAAQKVIVMGNLDPKTRTIQVESIAAVPQD